jgi:transposase
MIDRTSDTPSYPPVILTIELQLAILCGVLKKSRITSIYEYFNKTFNGIVEFLNIKYFLFIFIKPFPAMYNE